MEEEKKGKHDSVLFAEMVKPHESPDAFKEAWISFMEAVSELRKKHKMCDVLITVADSIIHEDGETGAVIVQHGFGNSEKQLALAAYSYGQLQAEHDELISKYLKGKATKPSK